MQMYVYQYVSSDAMVRNPDEVKGVGVGDQMNTLIVKLNMQGGNEISIVPKNSSLQNKKDHSIKYICIGISDSSDIFQYL